jgi:phosphoribosylformylglycinamidine cyclo-ligase
MMWLVFVLVWRKKVKLIDGSEIEIGDRIIGLASSGVHSNGFSLVRKIIEIEGLDWNYTPDLLQGKSLGEVLLTPTQIYVKPSFRGDRFRTKH